MGWTTIIITHRCQNCRAISNVEDMVFLVEITDVLDLTDYIDIKGCNFCDTKRKTNVKTEIIKIEVPVYDNEGAYINGE
jgi:hypothetical protein